MVGLFKCGAKFDRHWALIVIWAECSRAFALVSRTLVSCQPRTAVSAIFYSLLEFTRLLLTNEYSEMWYPGWLGLFNFGTILNKRKIGSFLTFYAEK